MAARAFPGPGSRVGDYGVVGSPGTSGANRLSGMARLSAEAADRLLAGAVSVLQLLNPQVGVAEPRDPSPATYRGVDDPTGPIP
jgi:hypothetical protein